MSVFMFAGLFIAFEASAQLKPTQRDVGNDCVTEEGKLGTFKNVHVEETVNSKYENSNTTSRSIEGGVGVEAGAGIGSDKTSASGRISASDAKSSNTSNSSGKSEKISYDDMRCVEDKNANIPQMTPVRW